MKTILIISGGIEAVPGIQLARSMGLYVVVSDGDVNAPGMKLADYPLVASTYNVDETLKKACEFQRYKRKIDGVLCIAADVPLTVAKVASTLKLPGIPVASAELAMNKLAMKDKFKRDGISIPKYAGVSSFLDLKRNIEDWGYPVVVKPIDSRGARGVLRLTEEIDLKWAWEYSLSNSPSGQLIMEKFLEGPQISTESMMIGGECYTSGFSDRNYEYLEKYSPHIIENGGDLPSLLPLIIQSNVKDLIKKAALSMGITHGIVKGDVVVHNDIPYIIELAARLSGGYFCTHEIPMNSGVDLVGNAIKMALGEKIYPHELIPKKNDFICQRYLFPEPGKVNSVSGLDNLTPELGVEYFDLRISKGDIIQPPVAHPSRPGMVITSGQSRIEAQNNAATAISKISISYS